MVELADQSAAWAAMGAVSREIALQHDLEKIICKYEGVYSRVIGEVPLTELNQKVKETA
jgi:hypothetical protein